MQSKLLIALFFVAIVATSATDVGMSGSGQKSIARQWNEILLDAIRNDNARPTVHARNLWHLSLVFWNSLVAYRNPEAQGWLFSEKVSDWASPVTSADEYDALTETFSYASYTFLKWRFQLSPGVNLVNTLIEEKMSQLGFPVEVSENGGENPAELGLRIAQAIIAFGLSDGANELQNYNNTIQYSSINPKLEVSGFGAPNWETTDPNRYQELYLSEFVGQSGILQTFFPPFVSPHWGLVTPFALTNADASCPDGGWNGTCVAPVYLDQGPPLKIDDYDFARDHFQVSIDSSFNDATDGVIIDIGPRSRGNNPFGTNDGTGYPVNPVTGEPYEPVYAYRGDYTRCLAEFWADGPHSETPPGHWNTILNYVNDQPQTSRRIGGQGDELGMLDWDVLGYFALNGAVHDAAVAAWSIKGHYDSMRPVGAIRYMCEAGQRSDPSLPRYHPHGAVLIPGFVEINVDNKFAGFPENTIMVYTWLGVDSLSQTRPLGSGWIECGNWVPYQRPNFVSPPFAGYVSGHSTFSRAAAEVLTSLTGSAYFPGGIGTFHMLKNEALVFEEGPSQNVTLTWATYYDAADESGLSRRYGGIHPKFDDTAGRIMGKEIGAKTIAKATQYYATVDFQLASEAPPPPPPPTPTPTPTSTTPSPTPEAPATLERGSVIATFSLSGQPCHGANVFNSQPISDWQEVAATFENRAWADYWTDYPFHDGPFFVHEMGILEPGATEAGPVLPTTPLDSLAATWVPPDADTLLFLGTTIPDLEARSGVPYNEVKTFTTLNLEYNDIPMPDPRTEHTGQLFSTRVKRPDVTLEMWNKAEGEVHLKCYENSDGVRTGSYKMKAKNLIPFMTYTVWAISAGSTNDAELALYASMFGGMPSMIVTDENGDGSIERDLAYCPLKIENPVMYFALAAHPDNIIWGPNFFGFTNPFPLGGSDHLCFNLGDTVANYLRD